MTKDERIDSLKNKISMALKDPILQLGFEIICKENAELKKRNGELAGQKASLQRWLGEAKDLIRNLLRVTYGEGWNYSLDWKVKAEQFLKEEEK